MTNEELLSELKTRHTGRARAAPSALLEAAFGVSGKELRTGINELRRRGNPICSDCRGYYYAATREELGQSIYQLGSRIRSIASAQIGLSYALFHCFPDREQTRLPPWEGR